MVKGRFIIGQEGFYLYVAGIIDYWPQYETLSRLGQIMLWAILVIGKTTYGFPDYWLSLQRLCQLCKPHTDR